MVSVLILMCMDEISTQQCSIHLMYFIFVSVLVLVNGNVFLFICCLVNMIVRFIFVSVFSISKYVFV